MESNGYCGFGNNEYEIFKTVDNGKNWESITGSIGNIKVLKPYGRIIIYSNRNEGLKYTDDNFLTIKDSNIMSGNWKDTKVLNSNPDYVYAESLEDRGTFCSKDKGETWSLTYKGDIQDDDLPDKTGDDIIFFLNEIIIPKLYTILTGYKDADHFPTSCVKIGSYYTDGSSLNPNNRNDINFVTDVGMKPMSINDMDVPGMPEVNNSKKIDDELMNKESRLYKTFYILDKTISFARRTITEQQENKVKNEKEDYSGLNDIDIPSMRMFYGVYKGSTMAVKNKIIDMIMSFDNNKKMVLLKDSIWRAAEMIKGPLQYKINEAKRKGVSQKYINIDIAKYWKRSLLSSIEYYFNSSAKNIEYISKNRNKKYISEAVDKYSNGKPYVLNECIKFFRTYSPMKNGDFIKTSGQVKNCLNRLRENTDFAIAQLSGGQLSPGDLPATLKGILDTFLKELDALPDDMHLKMVSDDMKEKYSEYIAANINSSNRNILNCLNFSNEEFMQFSSKYTGDEVETICRYLSMIISKFKERCLTLFDIVSSKALEQTISYIDIIRKSTNYINDLIYVMGRTSNYEEEYKRFNKYNYIFDDLTYLIDDAPDMLCKMTGRLWTESRGEI